MTRTPNRVDPAQPATTAEGKAAEARILASRGNISPLYRVLLHSLPIAQGWESLLTAVRQQTAIDPALRELIILRVAVLNRADYEYEAHLPYARAAGLSDQQIEALKGADRTGFSDVERLVLDYTDALTTDVHVDDALFGRVRAHFDPRGLVEVTATIAAYNMVSRFLIGLHVH
jgi:4-carboxymuconolactone decarboxylase